MPWERLRSVRLLLSSASAENIAVGNYGVAANGMPFAVALEKRLLQGRKASTSPASSRRRAAARRCATCWPAACAYGEANPGAIAVAIQQGADLKIISDNVLTVAEFVWAVKPDSPIKTIKDFKGKKIGYTNPRSTSQALAILLLQAGRAASRTTPSSCSTGGFGEGVAALDIGQIDVAPMAEPLWSKFKDKYRAVVDRERRAAAARQRRRRDDQRSGRRAAAISSAR